jgi:ribosomal protein L22
MPADDEDESYTSWVESSKVLLKRHSKEFIAEQEKISAIAETKEETKEEAKTETTEKVAEEKEETKASAEVEEVVEEVIENAEEVKEEIPNTTEASEPSVMEKYQQAFDLEQFEIKY